MARLAHGRHHGSRDTRLVMQSPKHSGVGNVIEKYGARIHITGIVQGVGFRPFVYGLAARLNLTGWVRNTSAGVDIEVDGSEAALGELVRALEQDAPPLAKIDSVDVESCPPNGFSAFEILHSEPIPGAFIPISPDVSICDDCWRELFDPSDQRYLYPFINCTNCGPRFTIIQDIPYDRPKTTMAPFEMCEYCRSEYEDPLNRRFHAQPVACAECGPRVWLEAGKLGTGKLGTGLLGAGKLVDWETGNQSTNLPIYQPTNLPIYQPTNLPIYQSTNLPITHAQQLLASGHILAIKGLGGFHLACDATNSEAVAELRRRKLRVDKPFALMMPDIETVEQHCLVNAAERELLESRQRPIVLLYRRPESSIARAVAPEQNTLGVMLPYTPLHYLLFSRPPTADHRPQNSTDQQIGKSPISNLQSPISALVMTSGNLSEEPIAYTNAEARERLASLADAFLMHNRDIYMRCDDSVVRVFSNQLSVITKQASVADRKLITEHCSLNTVRRSRGYAPEPIKLPFDAPPLLATGPELKNTFCLTKDRYAFISHHIGDLENYETLQSFEAGIEHFEQLFRIQPEAIACDMHPNYLATRYAIERSQAANLPIYYIQHHHSHIAACMADNGLSGERPVIGLSFDGTGYGDDSAIWGGEFLLADYRGYRRFAHLAYTPLPGGDKAIREPWRMALSWLHAAGIEWEADLPPVAYAADGRPPTADRRPLHAPHFPLDVLRHQLVTGLNAPPTSSMGRLFDAVAALMGVRQTVNYEAQAAIELEALADPDEEGAYSFDFESRPQTADRGPGTEDGEIPSSIFRLPSTTCCPPTADSRQQTTDSRPPTADRGPGTEDGEIPSSIFRLPSTTCCSPTADIRQSSAVSSRRSVVVDPSPVFYAITADIRAGVPIPKMAARFHNGVAQMAVQVCLAMRSQFGVNEVALSGGVWQNMSLLQKTIPLLEKEGFSVYIHRQVPANDGGLSLGQAVIAAYQHPE